MWRVESGTVNQKPDIDCDVFVIGAGLTGMCASLFAANRKLKVCQIGSSSPLIFHSGLFDLVGIYPVEERRKWTNPWEAIAHIRLKAPNHPYAKLCEESIRQSFGEISSFLNEQGLSYQSRAMGNIEMITAIGTVKTSYLAPLTMWKGIRALEEKSRVLIIGIDGLREFSSVQIQETLKMKWPELRNITIDLPICNSREKTPEHLARALEVASNRALLAERIKPYIKNKAAVGLPPILGLRNSTSVLADMEERAGCHIFEIPGLTPSVPGIRLKEIFESGLEKKGVYSFLNHDLKSISKDSNGHYDIRIKSLTGIKRITARGVILASGRFQGKGLWADRKKISETIFNIPVDQPKRRDQWFRKHFLDSAGHPINRAGLLTDSYQRPIDRGGSVFSDNLFAAGSILAHHDWAREKCGSGIAISTSFHAISSFLKLEVSKRCEHMPMNTHEISEAV